MAGLYGIKDAANIILQQLSDSKIALRSDYATVANAEYSNDTIYAMSKSTRAIRWDYGKKAEVKFSFEVFDLKWLSVLTGSSFVTGATNIMAAEYLTTSGATPTITLAATPVSGSLAVFLLNSDNITHGTEQTAGTPSSTQNAYSLSGRTVTLNATTAPAGTDMVVYYLKATEATAQKLSIAAEVFPTSYSLFMDTYIRNKDTNVDSYVQWNYPNVKPIGNFTITTSASDITKLDVTFDVFKDANGNLATFTVI
jgi:hypothetical protein